MTITQTDYFTYYPKTFVIRAILKFHFQLIDCANPNLISSSLTEYILFTIETSKEESHGIRKLPTEVKNQSNLLGIVSQRVIHILLVC